MSGATPKTTATKGMKVSFANTPQAAGDAFTLLEQDGNYLIDVLANDLGGEAKQLWALYATEPTTPEVAGAPDAIAVPDVGTFRIVDGMVEFDPTDAYAEKIDALAEGQAGDTFSFWYVIRMANGAFSKAQVTISFEGVNDDASIAGDLTAIIDEDDLASGTATVSDVDNGEAKFQAVDPAALETEWGNFTFVPGTGAWTFTPNDKADELNVGDTRNVALTVTSWDGTATQDIVVTINGTNDAATFGGDLAKTTDEDALASGKATVSDVDNDDAFLPAAADDLDTAWGTFTFDPSTGDWTFTPNDAADTLNVGDTEEARLTISAVDGTTTDIVVTITGTNDPATISGDLAATIDEDGFASGTASVSDVDDAETFKPVAAAALSTEWGDFTFNDETGAWTFAPNDKADELNVGDTREARLAVTSLDGTATQDIVVTIDGTNDAAQITGIATGTVKEDQFLTAGGTLTATDVDNPNGFQAVSGGAGTFGTFGIDTNGNWTYALSNALQAVQDLSTGGTLTDEFTFLSVDGTEAKVTVTINGTDEPVTVALDYTPPTPDEIIPGTPGTSVNLTFTLPTIQGVVGGTGTLQGPIPSGQWNQWQTWQTNLAAWRQANDPTGLDTNTATTPITVYWRQGGNPTQTEPFSYDNTITYTTSGTPDVIIPGDPAELVIIGSDAFLQWNADTDLTFTGATQAQIEDLVNIALLNIDSEGDIGDTLLTFTDGSTVTLFDAGFADFASFFASDQVSVIA